MEIFSKVLDKIKNRNNGIIGVGVNPVKWPEAFTTSLIIILVAFGSFGLGRLSRIAETKTPVAIRGMEASVGKILPDKAVGIKQGDILNGTTGKSLTANTPNEGFIVASKTGKKYHFPWCASAQTIKEENKIWFATKEEAEAAGYTPAANCRGL